MEKDFVMNITGIICSIIIGIIIFIGSFIMLLYRVQKGKEPDIKIFVASVIIAAVLILAVPLCAWKAHNTCPACGTYNIAKANFCSECGAKMDLTNKD